MYSDTSLESSKSDSGIQNVGGRGENDALVTEGGVEVTIASFSARPRALYIPEAGGSVSIRHRPRHKARQTQTGLEKLRA